MASKTVTVRLLIRGRVQGVSFRASMREHATLNSVCGWVRNTEDGGVEAVLQGDDQAVAKVVAWSRNGPAGARVSSVQGQELEDHPRQVGFKILA